MSYKKSDLKNICIESLKDHASSYHNIKIKYLETEPGTAEALAYVARLQEKEKTIADLVLQAMRHNYL